MDKRKTLNRQEVIELVKRYKSIIAPRFSNGLKIYLYGSYSKGNARPESDIDVAVIVPSLKEDWLELSTDLNLDTDKVSLLIEPILMEECNPSPLYENVLRTGIAI